MSQQPKKIEENEKDAKQDVQQVKAAELSEQELNDVAGGSTYSTTRSNIKATKL